MQKHIYVVDDEQNIRDIIKSYLAKEGFEAVEFADGESALQAFANREPDMMIIDIMMPGMSGFELCNEVRKRANTPIVMVSARDQELDRVLGIEMGADDYIMKPFSPRELVARVKGIFRRMDSLTGGADDARQGLVCRDVRVYATERRITLCKENEEKDMPVTTMEFDFIHFLVNNKNRVFTRDQLLSNIWGYQYTGDTRSVDDLVKRIRKKLDGVQAQFQIETVWGYGYKVTDL